MTMGIYCENLANTSTFNIVNVSNVGNRQPILPPDGLLANDNDYEIFFPETNDWTNYREHADNIRFYSCSFANWTCDVQWKNESIVFHTVFREASSKRARKKPKLAVMDSPRMNKCKQKSPLAITHPKPKHATMQQEPNQPNTRQQCTRHPTKSVFESPHLYDSILGSNLNGSNYITHKLGMSRKTIIASLTKEMQSEFFDVCWTKWNGHGCPLLILSPFSIKDGPIIEEWVRQYINCKGVLNKMPHLVYWYQQGWSESKGFKAFTLLKRGLIVSYEVGIQEGWDQVYSDKIAMGQELSMQEDALIRGISLMMTDQKLLKEERRVSLVHHSAHCLSHLDSDGEPSRLFEAASSIKP